MSGSSHSATCEEVFTTSASIAMGAISTSTLLAANTFPQACKIWSWVLVLWCKPLFILSCFSSLSWSWGRPAALWWILELGRGVYCVCAGLGCRIDSLICATSAPRFFNNAISELISFSSFNTSGWVLLLCSEFGFFLCYLQVCHQTELSAQWLAAG